MVNGKKIEKEVKKNQFCFAIFPRRPSVGGNDQETKVGNHRVIACSIDQAPEEITKLLNEYKEIVGEDIADGLPPMRSISHCMDLILGASLPN